MFFVVVWLLWHVVVDVAVVKSVESAVVALMVVDIVVGDGNVTETETLKQVLEALERYSATVACAVLIEQASQSLPRRVLLLPRSLVEKSVELVVRRHIRDQRRCQHQHQQSPHLHCRWQLEVISISYTIVWSGNYFMTVVLGPTWAHV